MVCVFCNNNELIIEKKNVLNNWGKRKKVEECEVMRCPICGELFFKPSEIKRLQELARGY